MVGSVRARSTASGAVALAGTARFHNRVGLPGPHARSPRPGDRRSAHAAGPGQRLGERARKSLACGGFPESTCIATVLQAWTEANRGEGGAVARFTLERSS